jgi:ElaA protein
VPWVERSFADLTTAELHEILWLRQRVFILEQACFYDDIDGKDPASFHLWQRDAAGALAAYLRILPPGLAYPEAASLGRVIVAPAARGTGLGQDLMREGMRRAFAHFPAAPIRIAAQSYLERFYASLGFRRLGPDYVADGIAHCEMVAEAPGAPEA